ncbi:FAD:protein FMN transferase [uncultured Nevskia sp.]|uniref:FAD:protein FMN transferase n=1 Tax=uncultured Nevskia sp. TaxID=228950 RepID=UPI0025F5885A|nr:FAD:protein FMN transferase [uncultured Nevskia sp.]
MDDGAPLADRPIELLIPAQFSAATHAGPDRAAQVVALSGTTMGTTWSVRCTMRAADRQDAVRVGIEAVLADLVAQLSHWEPSSALCRYNAAPAGTWQQLPGDFAEVLDAALRIAKATDGALDPTAGPLVDLWGFGPLGPRVQPPSNAEIEAARGRVGWQKLRRDRDRLQQPGGIALDFSAIAKGHAVDRVALWLHSAGLPHHLVEIGGELRGQGVKPDGSPWWVDVDGRAQNEALSRIALDSLSVATSGDAYRHYEHAGQRYAHTLDPRSGMPLVDAPAAVTVVHPLCREADGWSTALSVLGPDAGLLLADQLGLAVRYVLRDGLRDGERSRTRCSRAWAVLADQENA